MASPAKRLHLSVGLCVAKCALQCASKRLGRLGRALARISSILTYPKMGEILPKLGDRAMAKNSLSDALFSGVQRRVLALFFGRPDRSYYAAEIVRLTQSGSGAVDRELARLLGSGLINMERVGNQKHYRANPHSPIYQELIGLVRKTVGLKEPVSDALEQFKDKIRAAFVYGSVAKGTDTAASDIDLMIVADDLSYSDIYNKLEAAEAILNRSINPNILSTGEWRKKAQKKDSFVARLNGQPKIFVLGSESVLHGRS